MARTLSRSQSLVLLLVGLGLACKQPVAKTESAKAEATAVSASASAPAGDTPSGPCGEVEAKLCEKSGEESSTCAAAQLLAPILAEDACKAELQHIEQTFKKIGEQRKDCATLVSRLCAELSAETCKMVTDTTERFPPGQCTRMLGEFEQVLAELKKEDEKLKPVTGELLTAMHADNAPSFGPKDAKVTVVEFSDFQCPYCSKAATVAHQIKEKYSQVRFVFRQFPLSFHKEAHKASQAALAADKEGKFWEFHDALFANQRALEPDSLREYAKKVGVSDSAMKAALDSERYASQVDADIELGNKVGVAGTPSMFINGKRVSNPTDFTMVQQLIDEQLAAVN